VNRARLAFIVALVSSMARIAVAEPLYSLPWQLRPVTSENLVRVDSAVAAFNDDNGNLDIGVSSVATASYQLTTRWAPTIRLGAVGNNAPGAALDGNSFVNPVVGVTYTRGWGEYRLAISWGTTIPIGMGGGNDPDVGAEKSNAAAITARPADSAMFEANYLTQIAGAGFAYVNHGFTAQAEATLMQGVRVRGDRSASGTDRFRTNSAVALHVGYFLGSHVSLGGDVRYQRWLSHPTTLDAMTGANVPLSDNKLGLVTVAAGVRVHFHIGEHAIRPGIFYTRGGDGRGLDAPFLTGQTNAVQIDVPVTF